jgi:hypothetical protein
MRELCQLSHRARDEALKASYTACIYDLEDGTLHKKLLIYYPSTDMMPNEARYLDKAMKQMRRHSR